MATPDTNPLLTAKPSDSPLIVKLHPLVLITITDYITRHTLSERQGPIVGAVLGAQNGREVTLEHAFEAVTEIKPHPSGQEMITAKEPWFANHKEVHASPPLDLTAVFTLGSSKGPGPQHIPVVQQLKANYNDDALLVLFNPETILDGSLTGGQLPVHIYEAFYEPGTENADQGLQVDGLGMGRQLQLKFRQIQFEVDSGEAEMIGVDYVAKGAANASFSADQSRKGSTAATIGKGKGKATEQTNGATESFLSPEDEELIATLNSKANAIKMLHTRLSLITTYLRSLPPSYLNDPSLAPSSDPQIPHPLLRQINALMSRLPLLAPQSSISPPPDDNPSSSLSPPPHPADHDPGSVERTNVALAGLLSQLTSTVADARELMLKAGVVNRARSDRRMTSLARDLGYGGGGGGKGRGVPGVPSGQQEEGFDSGVDGGEEV